MLFRLTIYVENIENLTYTESTKKRDTHTFQRKQPAILFNAARNTSHTHTDTHKTMKS